jgi:hypothetical protein
MGFFKRFFSKPLTKEELADLFDSLYFPYEPMILGMLLQLEPERRTVVLHCLDRLTNNPNAAEKYAREIMDSRKQGKQTDGVSPLSVIQPRMPQIMGKLEHE